MVEEKVVWDKGLEFHKTYHYLLEKFAETDKLPKQIWIATAITQLKNGSRAGESVYAIVKWAETGEEILSVPIEKRKNAYRQMNMPKICKKDLREKYLQWFKEKNVSTNDPQSIKKLTKQYKVAMITQHKINTHSLRYCFVTYMLNQGVESALISKVIGHASTQHLIKYVQERKANEILNKIDL